MEIVKVNLNTYFYGSSTGTDKSEYYVVEAENAKGYRWTLDGFMSFNHSESVRKVLKLRINIKDIDINDGWTKTHPAEGSEAFYETYQLDY
tara:strand:- start:99 stop:371 length:273 start_codon:yes stop_codon:yes gene_type:complete